MAKRYALSKKTANRILGAADRVERTPVQRKVLRRNPRLRGSGGGDTRTWAKVITGLSWGSQTTLGVKLLDGSGAETGDEFFVDKLAQDPGVTKNLTYYLPWNPAGEVVEIIKPDGETDWHLASEKSYSGSSEITVSWDDTEDKIIAVIPMV